MKKRGLFVAFLLILMLASATHSYASIKASDVIECARVNLSTFTKKAAFTMTTKVNCDVLSVTSNTLYKINGVVVILVLISSSASGMRYSKSVDFSGYITSGNSYYVTAVFNADGETKNASSATVSF